MISFVQNINKNLQQKLQEIELEESSILDKASASIVLLEKTFEELKAFIIQYTFKCKEEEIHFFKKVKSHLFCKLIYYRMIYNIKTARPAGSNKAIKTYLIKELDRIQRYFEKSIDFYKYYRNKHIHFGSYYFLRGKTGYPTSDI